MMVAEMRSKIKIQKAKTITNTCAGLGIFDLKIALCKQSTFKSQIPNYYCTCYSDCMSA